MKVTPSQYVGREGHGSSIRFDIGDRELLDYAESSHMQSRIFQVVAEKVATFIIEKHGAELAALVTPQAIAEKVIEQIATQTKDALLRALVKDIE